MPEYPDRPSPETTSPLKSSLLTVEPGPAFSMQLPSKSSEPVTEKTGEPFHGRPVRSSPEAAGKTVLSSMGRHPPLK
ncbi:MAG: hypothetical protein KHX31_03240 [Akkermansia sp.]|jgi:hypothetical protein|uniref:hypothetical protein n=1 Tax=Akkermansia sp. TaxID=1872421 RepID=UPI0025B921BE|nr:hypothetical protein [Akkermansia sp.]MBS5507628.1 hypothetical protein [Akkermansia sp.]